MNIKFSILKNFIRKIIWEQYSPYSSFHKYDIVEGDCSNITFSGILYSDSFSDFEAEGIPQDPSTPSWATYENSTLFHNFLQQPNPNEWRKITYNQGEEKCIQFKGTVPPLTTTGPHQLIQGNIFYGGSYSTCQECIDSIQGNDGGPPATSTCNTNPDGPCAQQWFDRHANKYGSFMARYNCTGNYNFTSLISHLQTQTEAIINQYWTGGILPYFTAINNSNDWNSLNNAVNEFASYANMPNSDRGKLKRKLAKRLWAICMKNECC